MMLVETTTANSVYSSSFSSLSLLEWLGSIMCWLSVIVVKIILVATFVMVVLTASHRPRNILAGARSE